MKDLGKREFWLLCAFGVLFSAVSSLLLDRISG